MDGISTSSPWVHLSLSTLLSPQRIYTPSALQRHRDRCDDVRKCFYGWCGTIRHEGCLTRASEGYCRCVRTFFLLFSFLIIGNDGRSVSVRISWLSTLFVDSPSPERDVGRIQAVSTSITISASSERNRRTYSSSFVELAVLRPPYFYIYRTFIFFARQHLNSCFIR